VLVRITLWLEALLHHGTHTTAITSAILMLLLLLQLAVCCYSCWDLRYCYSCCNWRYCYSCCWRFCDVAGEDGGSVLRLISAPPTADLYIYLLSSCVKLLTTIEGWGACGRWATGRFPVSVLPWPHLPLCIISSYGVSWSNWLRRTIWVVLYS